MRPADMGDAEAQSRQCRQNIQPQQKEIDGRTQPLRQVQEGRAEVEGKDAERRPDDGPDRFENQHRTGRTQLADKPARQMRGAVQPVSSTVSVSHAGTVSRAQSSVTSCRGVMTDQRVPSTNAAAAKGLAL